MKNMLIVLVSLVMFTSCATLDLGKKGVQPPREVLIDAERYCEIMLNISALSGDHESAANWNAERVNIKKARLSYGNTEKKTYFNDVYVYAGRYREQVRQNKLVLEGFKSESKLACNDDPIAQAIERLEKKKK